MAKIKKLVSSTYWLCTKELVKYPYLKFTFSVPEIWIHVRIKQRWVNHGFVYEKLVKRYIDEWMDTWTAMKQARKVIMDFYSACDELTKEWQPPFLAVIDDFDPDKQKHEEETEE